MKLTERIHKDMTDAMRSREEHKLSTLRMMKSALKSREIENRAPVEDAEAVAVLGTMIKQRKDSIEQFNKGGRPELAAKEAAEIVMIEVYMPKAASDEEIVAAVRAAIKEMGSPTMKEMGAVMKNAMAKFAASGTRADGKVVSETVKRELAGK